jgi:hypothetical protein
MLISTNADLHAATSEAHDAVDLAISDPEAGRPPATAAPPATRHGRPRRARAAYWPGPACAAVARAWPTMVSSGSAATKALALTHEVAAFVRFAGGSGFMSVAAMLAFLLGRRQQRRSVGRSHRSAGRWVRRRLAGSVRSSISASPRRGSARQVTNSRRDRAAGFKCQVPTGGALWAVPVCRVVSRREAACLGQQILLFCARPEVPRHPSQICGGRTGARRNCGVRAGDRCRTR